MAKAYRAVLRDQPFLLPVDMREWLPADHLVWFVLDVVEQLDTAAFHRRRRKVKAASGRAGFDPEMLLALLLYGYCQGVRSSRQIERLCEVDVAFRVICAQDTPDHSVIARFRQAHREAFADLFTQVLRLAVRAGLGRFGTIAIDGTKIAANASIDANRTEDWLREQVETILAEAARTDAAEDAEHGDRRGDEPPAGFADPTARAEKIRAALAEIDGRRPVTDEDVTASAGEQAAEPADQQGPSTEPATAQPAPFPARRGRWPAGQQEVATIRARLDRMIAAQQAKLDAHAAAAEAAAAAGLRRPAGRRPTRIEDHVDIARVRASLVKAQARAATRERRQTRARQAAAQRAQRRAERLAAAPPSRANLTDPHSRLMPTRRGWVQGYNVQLAVTDDQLILATGVGQTTGDIEQFLPMLAAAQRAAEQCRQASDRTDLTIEMALADAGYASDTNLCAPGPDRLIALGKAGRVHADAHRRPAAGPPPPGATPREAMDHRLRTPEGLARYKRRGATVEPAIGNLKKIITRFSSRGLPAATAEIDLAAAAFNLLKIHRAQPAPA